MMAARLSLHFTVTGIALTWAVLQAPGAQGQCATPGTTPGIREIVLGKCLQYHTLYPDEFCENGISTRKNCTQLADLFMSAFSYQPTCNVTLSRYDNFIRAAHIDVPVGQNMFWSDVYEVVSRYGGQGKRARPIADTLIGYFGDAVRFCAQEDDPGVIYNQDCAGWDQTENCSHNAELSFWATASTNYASTARGEAQVMLNASLTEAFYNTSFFGVWELPHLDPSKITEMKILLVHIPGQEIRSTCKSDNIANLRQKLTDRNITSTCEESPWDVQTMVCTDYPNVEECIRGRSDVVPSAVATVHGAIRLTVVIYSAFWTFVI